MAKDTEHILNLIEKTLVDEYGSSLRDYGTSRMLAEAVYSALKDAEVF